MAIVNSNRAIQLRPTRAIGKPDHSPVSARPGKDPSPTADTDRGPATIIASRLASRLRDGDARRRVVLDATRALAERGHADIDVVEATLPDEVRTGAAAAVRRGSTTVVIAGGDGTVRDAAGVLAGTGIDVAILPCGTGNLYATSVGVPRDIGAAVALIPAATGRAYDLADVTLIAPPGAADTTLPPAPITFGVACGTGFDAQLIAGTTRSMKRQFGVAAYFITAARLVRRLEPRPTALTIDGVRTELESVVVLIANTGEALPGVLRPRLPVHPDDGMLHVFVLPRGGILGGVRGAVELLTAGATGVSSSGAGIRLTGTEVRVEVSPPEPTQVDGDPFPPAWLDVRARPGALRVLRP
jgi:diacylglycerol kinase family enzyme